MYIEMRCSDAAGYIRSQYAHVFCSIAAIFCSSAARLQHRCAQLPLLMYADDRYVRHQIHSWRPEVSETSMLV